MAESKKIVSIENRIPQLKKYRRKKLFKHLVILVGFLIILVLITLYLLSPFSKIDRIIISGNKQLTESEIKKASGIKPDDFVFAINNNKVRKKLKKLPLLKKVKAEKQGLNDYRLIITEYKTIGYQEKSGVYYEILESGFIITNKSRKIPIDNQTIFKNFKNNTDLKDMVHQINELPEEIVLAISEINLVPTKSDPRHIELYMNDGNKIEATISTFAKKMSYYPSFVAQLNKGQKGILNLEVGSFFQSYYKQNEEIKKQKERESKLKNK